MFPVIRHASSHGLALLICTIVSALLIELLKPRLPHLMKGLDGISLKIINTVNLPFTVETMDMILLASILAVIWGIFFKVSLSKSQ